MKYDCDSRVLGTCYRGFSINQFYHPLGCIHLRELVIVSGNPPDKPDENAKTRGTWTTEKIARTLADHEESKWPLDRPGDTPALPQSLGRRSDRTEEAGRGHSGAARLGLGPRLSGEPERERTPPGGLLTLREPLTPTSCKVRRRGHGRRGEPQQREREKQGLRTRSQHHYDEGPLSRNPKEL
ncbi:hypothetical protein NDU88_002820 [Pleurodeles waltl]|uniref:Uncharacterized protein n=1 Tax=Pleurodeles waltl TaxID=8319 RepID=A0AAV7PB41_PLEWA|nr:hypothetical protein NDU88_002820 [Pleurodeles waltl]